MTSDLNVSRTCANRANDLIDSVKELTDDQAIAAAQVLATIAQASAIAALVVAVTDVPSAIRSR